jgi:hypothetical protein
VVLHFSVRDTGVGIPSDVLEARSSFGLELVETLAEQLGYAVLIDTVPDWRWLYEREDSPWYPTMRLFRQTGPGDWAGLLERIADALAQEFPDVQKKQYSDYRLITSGFNRVTRTRQGFVLYNRFDKYIGRSIDRYGEFSAGETDLFKQVVRSGWTVVEAGANIGAHTLLLSRQAGPRGTVYAFEPHAANVHSLLHNISLNRLTRRIRMISSALPTKSASSSINICASKIAASSLPRVAPSVARPRAGYPAGQSGGMALYISPVSTPAARFCQARYA